MTELRVRIDESEDLQFVQDWMAEKDEATYQVVTGESEGALAIEPVTAVLIGAGVAMLAGFIRDGIDSHRGGTVVDLRPGVEDQVHRDKALNYGWLMVISADGKVEINVKDATERLIEQVISGVFTSVTDIAKATKEALGGDKVKPETPE